MACNVKCTLSFRRPSHIARGKPPRCRGGCNCVQYGYRRRWPIFHLGFSPFSTALIVTELRAEGLAIADTDLVHVWPLQRRHVVPSGVYFVNRTMPAFTLPEPVES